ncbi:hypothetical protein A7K91_04905 [Paenibacillus oryzae]|uniref:LamG-like jellyroll fold domain-containing protein n=1 Tax=Paenibacillus oryzae TaxID=1844972 RepID=A0A1A5YH56_9BACL|nr:LamG-like jellyroll fold domain-containing protein [Paenibacillus oryzae]OBR64922.1 hypothetical protein A7K91_04905 [Paenibacillus oryzae]
MANTVDNMQRCGVAWFKMDESGGNLVDSKGNFVGTNNGSTVIQGVSGNARRFNGTTNRVQINGLTLTGAVSIRVKIRKARLDTTWAYFMGTLTAYATQRGMTACVDWRTGGVYFGFGGVGLPIVYVQSTQNIADNQWHDILFTWDGKIGTDNVKLYVDDMSTPNAVASAAISNDFIHTYSYVTLGGLTGNGGTVCDIDELEIYNDVISAFPDVFLIKHEGLFKTYSNGAWISLGTNATASDFHKHGIVNSLVIPQSGWQSINGPYEIHSWTDSPDKVNVMVTETYDTFKPIDFLDGDVDVITWSDVPSDRPLNLRVEGEKYMNYRYKVEMEGHGELKPWSSWGKAAVSDHAVIKSQYVTSDNPYTIRVTVEQDNGTTVINSGTVTLINTAPSVIVSMLGMRAQATIDDSDGDTVSLKVLLNGKQIHPAAQVDGEFTGLAHPPITWTRSFRSNEINIGTNNTLTVVVKDKLGRESHGTVNFVGEYSGLMFADELGGYYSTDLEEVLQYLDAGIMIAGQISDTYPIRLINKTGTNIKDIRLWREQSSFPVGAKVELSKSNKLFQTDKELIFPETLGHGEEVTFFARVVTVLGSAPGAGIEEIVVVADPD